VQNVSGVTPAQATSAVESNGQIGNLQLSSQQEADLVNFLKILSNGYTRPKPVDCSRTCVDIVACGQQETRL
jgi:hypothetical protein